jgi:hypothetical protein
MPILIQASRQSLFKKLRKEYLDAETQRIVDTEAAFVALYDSLRKYD